MSGSTDPTGLTDIVLQAFVRVLAMLIAFWAMVWIIIHIWIWIVGAGLLFGGGWLLIRWLRWRHSRW